MSALPGELLEKFGQTASSLALLLPYDVGSFGATLSFTSIELARSDVPSAPSSALKDVLPLRAAVATPAPPAPTPTTAAPVSMATAMMFERNFFPLECQCFF